MKRVLNFWVIFGMILTQSWAAAPTWSVNPNAYDYNMTMTAALDVACTELENPSNMLGAFVGTELRGVATSSSVIDGRYLALMTIYSNISSGETVEFKIYNQKEDKIYDTKTSVSFQDDAVFGTPSIPFLVKTNNEPIQISLSDTTILENQVVSTVIGNLTTTDKDNDVYTYSLISGNSNFTIDNNELKSSMVFNYENQENYQIRLKTDDGKGCSLEKTITIQVLDANDLPSNIQLSAFQLSENNKVGAEIGMFTSVDDDAKDTHIYSLVSGIGDVDNSKFTIVGNILKAAAIYDYEGQKEYNIRVQSNDGTGIFEKEFIIEILDINDKPTAILLDVKTIVENNKVGTTIGLFSTTDQDVNDAHSYAFSDTPGNNNDNFFIVGNQLKAAKSFDFEILNEFYIYVSSFDSEQKSITQLFVITVTDGNDAPTAIILSNLSVAENQPAKTFISKIATKDPDAGQSHAYTLSNGVGDIDNGSFIIQNDSLFSNVVFDVAIKSSYSIRIQTDDKNGATYSEQFSVFVKDINNNPTDIYLSNSLVLESESIGTVVGNFTSADADLGDGHTYSLVAGSDDNASFVIFGNELKTNVTFDYETKIEYKIRVKTSDNFGGYFEKEFTIKVTNGNDNPSDITLNNLTIDENVAKGLLVGAFTTTDLDVGDTHIYSLIDKVGMDNDKFVIVGNELKTSFSFDYEIKDTYVINVMTDDNKGGTFTKQFIITINDQNDAPHLIEITSDEVQEEQIIGTVVGVFSTEDVDVNDTHTYSFVAGKGSDDNAKFTLSKDTLKTALVFDISAQLQYTIRVQTTDLKGQTFEQFFVIKIKDINDAPKEITLSNNLVSENMPINTLIGSFTTTDDDANDTHTYSLVSGIGSDDNASLIIFGNELKTNSSFDFETKSTYSIRVQTSDGKGGIFEKVFEIKITDANDKPLDIALSNAIVDENQAKGLLVGTFTTTDLDKEDSHIYSLVDKVGMDNDKFVIVANELKTSLSFDYEIKNTYVVNVMTDDNKGGTFTKQFIITINDQNDAPHLIEITSNEVNEEQAVGTIIGVFSTEDVDVNDTHTYSLITGKGSDDNAKFNLSKDTLKTALVFDISAQLQYTIRVQTTDLKGQTFEQFFVIKIKDINDAPKEITLSNNLVGENMPINTLIGSFTTTDDDANDTHTYTLVSGIGDTSNTIFLITGNEIKTNGIFDYEVKNTYSIRVQTNDGKGGTFEKIFQLKLTDANDKPSNVLLDNLTIAENVKSSTLVGTFTTIDQDKNDNYIYSFVDTQGNDNDEFLLFDNELKTNNTFDFETKDAYVITIRSTDIAGQFIDKKFNISVVDSNDAPTAISLSDNTIDEQKVVNTFIGFFETTDVDAVDNHTYSLVNGKGGEDNAHFTIVGNELKSATVFKYNEQKTYNVLVQSLDKKGEKTQQTFVILINDKNDAPTAIYLSSTSIKENESINTFLAKLTTEDIDVIDKHTYSLVSGTGGKDNNKFMIKNDSLFSDDIFDYENKNSYSIRLKTTDSGGENFEQVFEISIEDVNEKPTLLEEIFTISETSTLGFSLGTIKALDEDENQILQYQIVKNETSKNVPFKVDLLSGELILNANKLDYENMSIYSFDVLVFDDGKNPLTDTTTITVEVLDEIEGFLPATDFISVNGDGKNDTWKIKNVELYGDYELVIFSANGQVVYKLDNNYQNDWEGTLDGKKLPVGSYYYMLRNTTEDKLFKGTISLVH